METNATSQNEVARLNRIIAVLLDQLEVLKRENEALKSGDSLKSSSYPIHNSGDAVKSPGYPIPKSGDGIENENYTSAKSGDGIEHTSNLIPQNCDGIENKNYTSAKSGDGIENPNYTSAKSGDGIEHENYLIPKSGDGIEHANHLIPKNDDGIKYGNTHIINNDYRQIEVNNDSIVKLESYLRKDILYRASRSTFKSVANELLLLHNSGLATGHELRKIAHLSIPGFAKHLPMLKRKGLVNKQGIKKYGLTPFAKNIIANLFFNET